MYQKITKDMLIAETIEKYPDTAEVLLDAGVACVGCHISHFETLEQGLSSHGMLSEKEIEKVIEDMNSLIKENDKNSRNK